MRNTLNHMPNVYGMFLYLSFFSHLIILLHVLCGKKTNHSTSPFRMLFLYLALGALQNYYYEAHWNALETVYHISINSLLPTLLPQSKSLIPPAINVQGLLSSPLPDKDDLPDCFLLHLLLKLWQLLDLSALLPNSPLSWHLKFFYSLKGLFWACYLEPLIDLRVLFS